MTYKNMIIPFSFILIIGLAVWTTLLSYPHEASVTSQTISMPDAFMEDVISVSMNKQGKPTMKILTPKMVHYAENDTTLLTSPQLMLYRKSKEPWYITSKHAKATQGVEMVNFWDNVTVQHAADENTPATLIKTETLTVHPPQLTAQTDEFITLMQPNLSIKATGMTADMNTGNIKLLSKARGEYEPS